MLSLVSSIRRSFWKSLISAELFMHVHICFGLMTPIASRMEKGNYPHTLAFIETYSIWDRCLLLEWSNQQERQTRNRRETLFSSIFLEIKTSTWPQGLQPLIIVHSCNPNKPRVVKYLKGLIEYQQELVLILRDQ